VIENLIQRINKSGNDLAPFLIFYIDGAKTLRSVQGAYDWSHRDMASYQRWIESPTEYLESFDECHTLPLDFKELERKVKALKWLRAELREIIQEMKDAV